jgi:hypothetical protein
VVFFAILPQTIGHQVFGDAGNAAVRAVAAMVAPEDPAAATSLDLFATGSVALGDSINRAGKTDLLVARHGLSISAGVIQTVGLFSADDLGVRGMRFAVSQAPVNDFIAAATLTRTPLAPAETPSAMIVPKPVLLAYASPGIGELSQDVPFDAVIADPNKLVLDPDIGANHAWLNTRLPAGSDSTKQMKCLATAIYFEARGEPERGQLAVAQVVLNRLKNPTYPDTICDVVYQNSNMRHRCQFSFACDGIKDRITDQRGWAASQELAKRILADSKNLYMADIGAATHYHATYVRPSWARQMKQTERIGHHIFYTTYGGGWM